MNILIYSRNTCSPCKAVKQYLTKKNLTYTEKNVDESLEAQDEAFKLSGMSSVPVTVITKDDGTKDVITGLNFSRLASALA